MKKIRAGVIGTGYLGKFHAEKYSRIEDVDLVGVVDTDKKRAESIAAELGTTPYTNHEDLFGKVDAVSIVVPTSSHYPVARDFLDNGVDVLLEKPMTITLEEADALIDIATEKKRIIQVGLLERYNPAVVSSRDIVKQPQFIEAHRLCVYNPRGTDVSVVLDLMIHDIDIILSFVASGIKNIHAYGESLLSQDSDIASARLEFENGCVANITASRIAAKNERTIHLLQKGAYISLDFANTSLNIVSPGNGSDTPGTETKTLNLKKGDALQDEIRAFIKSVKTREVPEVSGEAGRKALAVALSVMEKIQNASMDSEE